MRAPVEFVVTRHKLTHPDDSPSQSARHCNLHQASTSRAMSRLKDEILDDARLLSQLLAQRTTPSWPAFYFRVPNPDNWIQAMKSPHWLTGEAAAAIEGINIVPSRVETYIRRENADQAVDAARRSFAKASSPRDANLVIRIADPWLYLDEDDALVERGQRLLDYARSSNVQFAKELATLG